LIQLVNNLEFKFKILKSYKKKEIEAVKETITNLNFELLQANSSIESAVKNHDKLIQSIDAHSKNVEKRLIGYKEKEDQMNL